MEPTSQIREKIDLVSFIGELVTLKKAGRNFRGLCPFHNESTPSFMVSPERQIWHCFGCGKGGDVFSFLMEYERMEFPEALRTLAQRTGVELPKTSRSFREASSKKERLYEMNKVAANMYHYLLTKHKVGTKAKEYVLGRGTSEKVIETFRLGFAPNAGETLVEYMQKKHKYSREDLLEAGLATLFRGRLVDFFRGRLMFPLIDQRDNVIGFAGRILEQSDSVKAKYINTRDTIAYHKGETVYGLNISKDAIRKANQAILVEGEFDLLSCFQHGISNVVAIKGTALTEYQVGLIGRYAQKITICFDGDSAGQEALRKSLPIIEKKGLTTTVILVPQGKDPDEALKTNEAEFRRAADHDIPVYDYLLNQITSQYDPRSMDGKRKISEILLPLIQSITNEIIKEHYLRKLSTAIDTSYESLQREAQRLQKRESAPVIVSPPKEKRSREEILEEYLIALILQAANPSQALQDAITTLSDVVPKERAYQKLLFHLVAYLKEHETFDGHHFSNGLPAELSESYNISVLLPLPPFENGEEHGEEVSKTAASLRAIYLRQKLKELGDEIKKREAEGNEEEIGRLQETFSTLASQLKK